MYRNHRRPLSAPVVSVFLALSVLGAAACASSDTSNPLGTTDAGVLDAGVGDAAVVTDAASAPDVPAESATSDAGCAGPGSLDPSFGDGGVALPIIGGTLSNAQAVAIEPATQLILIGGSARHENALGAFAVVRLQADGEFDTSFGGNGITLTAVTGYDCFLTDILLQSDGKLIGVGGANGPPGNAQIALVRYDRDGTLDMSFGNGGIVTTSVGPLSQAHAVAMDQQDRIVVAAQTWDGPNSTDPARFVTLRYLPSGMLDPSFGTNGVVITSFGTVFPGVQDLAYDVKIQSDGHILVAGGANPASNDVDFGVVRYDANGALDLTYGDGGKAVAAFATGAAGQGMALDSLGRAVLAGETARGAGIARLGTNGQLDGTFGVMGTYVSSPYVSIFRRAVISPVDSKIIAVGAGASGGWNSLMVGRFNTDGTPDSSFGVLGYVAVHTTAQSTVGADVAVQEDGRIVAVGTKVDDPRPQDFVAVRYCP